MMVEKKNEHVNWTDPDVKFDPEKMKSVVVKQYTTQKDSETGQFTEDGSPRLEGIPDQKRLEGVRFPIIKLNNIVIDMPQIESMTLLYDSFTPELILTVNDYDNSIKTLDVPGMTNKITLVMIPPIEGAYRKISLDFYISEVNTYDRTLVYRGKYYCPELEKTYNKIFKTENSNKLNTYDFLYQIAKDSTLGFAATDKCEDILDTNVRIAMSQNIESMIKQHIRFGGVGKDSYFDCWVDIYNTLVMVNLPFIFDADIKLEELVVHNVEGLLVDDTIDFNEDTQHYTENMPRLLTNAKHISTNMNCMIKSWRSIVDNDSIIDHGTHNIYYTVKSINAHGNNSIDTRTIDIVENSKSGEDKKDSYMFYKQEFIGCELASNDDGNTPILFQEKERSAYIARLNAKRLEIVLEDPNLGLQRGTLVGVSIYEYEESNKMRLLGAYSLKKGNDIISITDLDTNDQQLVRNPGVGILIDNVSGMYYIDGMKFVYEDGQMLQHLFLIKKNHNENTGDIFNFTTEEIEQIKSELNK